MKPLPKEQHDRLVDVATNRFFNRIDLLELYFWLDNFQPEEYEMAITLLEHVDYYRESDFVSLLKNAIDKLQLNNNSKLHFIPIGDPGKSGYIVLYQLQKLYAPIKNKAFFYSTPDSIEIEQLLPNDYIILVDDFIGSGRTVDKFLDALKDKERLLQFPRLCLICGIIMKSGLGLLHRKYTIPYHVVIATGDIKYKAFEKGESPFGGYVRMKRMRDFCYKYGLKLYREGPLGFKNTQSLVIIEHSSPNDSLPILWSSRKKWVPLAPRSYDYATERATQSRQDNNRWISLFKKTIGLGDHEEFKDMFSGDNYTLLLILKLLMEKKTESVIANILGMTFEDMQRLKAKGIDFDYWDQNWDVSDFTKKQYKEAIAYFKRINRSDEDIISEREDERNMIYVPETFRGLK